MPETPGSLDVAAFKHVVVPIGVVVGLGVARLMTAASHYLQQRGRVRFSVGHVLWCTILFLWMVGLWWIAWGLRRVDTELWSYFTLIFLMSGPCLMYLAVTLILPDLPEQGELDLGERFETLGRPFFLSLGGFVLWLACTEMWLLHEPWLVLPKRLFQVTLLLVAGIGAALPSRRVATMLAAIVLPLSLLALATVRAKLG